MTLCILSAVARADRLAGGLGISARERSQAKGSRLRAHTRPLSECTLRTINSLHIFT